MRVSIISFGAVAATSRALTFTSPAEGEALDPTQPITVRWTPDPADPSIFDLLIDKPGGLVSNQKIATKVSSSDGTYIVAANAAAMTYGDGFVLKAQSRDGATLATSPPFALSVGSATTINGQISYISTNTFTGATEATGTGTAQSILVATDPANTVITSSDVLGSSTETGSSSAPNASKTGRITSTTISVSLRAH